MRAQLEMERQLWSEEEAKASELRQNCNAMENQRDQLYAKLLIIERFMNEAPDTGLTQQVFRILEETAEIEMWFIDYTFK